jgi:transposase-like protein
MYIQGLSSYRVVAAMLEQRLGRAVPRVTLNEWVLELGERAKTPLEVSIELQPDWGGFLGVDGKVIRVKGDKRCLLIGVDHPTQDLVHALVLDSETADGFARLATEARLDAGHALAGVVSDLGPGFAQTHRDHFGSVPFQACRVHFDRRLDQEIPKSLWSAKAPLYAELKERIRAVLYADDYDQAVALLQALTRDRARLKGIGKVNMIRSLERTFDLFMAHHFTPGLPADNNVTENVIKQLNKKLRLMEGFESIESAERYVRLLVGCYRFKRFTDSHNGSNGKAPLELAGVDLAGRDWLSFLTDR